MATKKSQPAKPNYQGSLADYKASIKKSGNSIPGPIISAPTVYGALDNARKSLPQVLKESAIDLGSMAVGGAAGKVLGKVFGKVAGRAVANEVFERLAPNSIKTGGKVFTASTPFGKTLASTKIMTEGQTSAAAAGLTKIASNRANEVGSQIASKVASGTRTAARGASTAAIVAKSGTSKNKKDTRKK